MNITNGTLNGIKNRIDNLLSSYRNKQIDVRELVNEADILKSELVSQVTKFNSLTNMKLFPSQSKRYFGSDYRTISESQKTRAYMLLNQPIELIRSELEKEYENENTDFVTTLCQAVFMSDRARSEKASLSNFYQKVLDSTGASESINNGRQAKVLLDSVNAIMDNIDLEGDELVSKVNLKRS